MDPVLLISLGTSPAIAPEAFLIPDVEFSAVHILTSEAPCVDIVRKYFPKHAPQCDLTVSRVNGFTDLKTEKDHFHFEEVLARWVLLRAPERSHRWICVGGGFKTMSNAMQKIASVLGAAQVFHVIAEGSPLPSTVDEVLEAERQKRIHWIRLGSESGWPQLRDASCREFPLSHLTSRCSDEFLVDAPDSAFSDQLKAIVKRSHHIADQWVRISELPFVELATWSPSDLQWLESKVDPEADRQWIARIPKVELHCHLGGFATDGTALESIRSEAINPQRLRPVVPVDVPSDWPIPAKAIGLEPYRKLGDNNGSTLLKDSGCLKAQCRNLYAHLLQERVVYAEIRCSPANYAEADGDSEATMDSGRNRSPWKVLQTIRDTFNECILKARDSMEPIPCHVNLILIGTRQDKGDFRPNIARHLALAVTAAEHWNNPKGCCVVGVDLAGYENVETRAHYFREEFQAIHRCGLALTVHAGENDDSEAIWRAVFDLNARRIGHGLTLKQSPDLLRSISDRGVGIEMCPYANLQIKGFALEHAGEADARAGSSAKYPLKQYLNEGVRVTVNTDNIGISAASLTDNLLLAGRLCPELTRMDVLRLQRNAIDTAFASVLQRAELLTQVSRNIPLPSAQGPGFH